jgi:hypothetical protein
VIGALRRLFGFWRAGDGFAELRELGQPLLSFLEAARLPEVLDAQVLVREAAARRMDPGELLLALAPRRAVFGRLEVVRLTAAAHTIIANYTGFEGDTLRAICRLCDDLQQDSESKDFRSTCNDAVRVAYERFKQLAHGGRPEDVLIAETAEERAAGMGMLLALEFVTAWDDGNRQPSPSAKMQVLAKNLILAPAQVGRLRLDARR